MMKPTVAVAMSGGVDSSVTAALLKQQGYPVIGITMVLFAPHGVNSASRDASIVAEHLGIPHHVVDFSSGFSDLIINNFVSEYACGHTPNPCVACNRFIKFGLLLDKAKELGAQLLATGHYVRNVVDQDGICHLRTARCIKKDQSYFLYTLGQERLRQVLFPLGDMESKDEVRRLARELGLPVADKGDSQEVCFIPNDDYIAYLEKRDAFAPASGEICHIDGRVLGRHMGTHRYTIGQRKGLGIAWSEPLYVVEIDAEKKRVIVAEEQHVTASGLVAGDLQWIVQPSGSHFRTACKIRYRHSPVGCQVSLSETGCEVRFDQPQKAVTPGQAVVFYQGDEVLGGGRIVAPIK